MRYWSVLFLGVVVIMVFGGLPVSATSGGSWVGETLKVEHELSTTLPPSSELSCTGSTTRIQVAGSDVFRTACVYGAATKLQVARVMSLAGQYEYVVSYPGESRYYSLRSVCVGVDKCVYSQAEDTLVHKALRADGTYTYRVVKNFSKQLQKDNGSPVSYSALGLEGDLLLDGAAMTSIGLSSNGRWVVIEVAQKGIVRVDLRTGRVGWIASLVVTGASPQPIVGLSVSNDGRWVATTGWYQGFTVYEVGQGCGQEVAWGAVTKWCTASSVTKATLLPGYVRAYRPIFTSDGMHVTFLLVKQQSIVKITVAPESQLNTDNVQYLAYGDSYTSGEGELADSYYLAATNTATNHCHVSTRSYPLLLGDMWQLRAANQACSGGRIADVRTRLEQQSTGSPMLISLGIGGNDVDLIGKLKTCLGPGTCEWAREGMRLSSVEEMRTILPNLIQLISDMKQSSTAAVFVVGYPSIINPDSASCDMVTASLLSHDERVYIEESIKYLNTVLQTAARYSDVTYVDISQSLVGERLCEGGQHAMNGVRLGDDIAPITMLNKVKFIGAESFHPTPVGHDKIAQAIQARYGAFWAPSTCGDCTVSVEYPRYWTDGAMGAMLMTQVAARFMAYSTLMISDLSEFTFPADSFAPGSSVRLEVRSDSTSLGTYPVAGDGSVNGVITVPAIEEGYHTVHAIGTSPSGESLDLYETVYVRPQEGSGTPPDEAANPNATTDETSTSGALGETHAATDSVSNGLHGAVIGDAHQPTRVEDATGPGEVSAEVGLKTPSALQGSVLGTARLGTSLVTVKHSYVPLWIVLLGVVGGLVACVLVLFLVVFLLHRRRRKV